jgi:hypothetical protein
MAHGLGFASDIRARVLTKDWECMTARWLRINVETVEREGERAEEKWGNVTPSVA